MSIRTEKVSAVLKTEMGYIIEKYLQGEISALLTVTSVVMSPDLKNAKFFISVFNQSKTKEEIINRLNFHKKHIRHLLGQRISLKYTPEIHFYIDETMEEVEKFEKIFQQIHKDENSRT